MSDMTTAAAQLPVNLERAGDDRPLDGVPPLPLGALESRQRDVAPPWGGTLTEGVPVVDVVLRAAGIRCARSADDVAADQAAWGAALTAAGVAAGDACLVLLPGDGEGSRDGVLAGLVRLGACAQPASGDLPRLAIAEQRQLRARVLIATRTLALALQSTVYAEFPLEPADLGLERIVLVGELAGAGEGRRIAEEFEADLSQVAVGPLGRPLGVSAAGDAFAPVDGSVVACWDGDAYVTGGEGELVVTTPGAEAMPIVNLSTGLGGSVDDGGAFRVTGRTVAGVGRMAHRLIAGDSVRRVMRLVPGVADWRLEIARPGREDVATLLVHASRDEHEPIARNAERELAERLGLAVEVRVSAPGDDAPYEDAIAGA
jgi:phenylacetate-CoA ligase